jgi:rhodanese-related sulfurtransferase
MSSNIQITPAQLSRLVGLPDAPVLLDVRIDEDVAADPRLLPASGRRSHRDVADWAGAYAGRKVVVICQRGQKLSEGVAAWLRHEGDRGREPHRGLRGLARGRRAAGPRPARCRQRDAKGRTLWVTRARPKVDRIACPWLIRRFVDPKRRVPVRGGERGVGGRRPLRRDALRHRRGVLEPPRRALQLRHMIEEFGLGLAGARPARDDRARRRHGALDLAPQAAGFLAASLGLSRMFRDDLAQLEAGMLLYDAFYRWCRDASEETHNWPAARGEVLRAGR